MLMGGQREASWSPAACTRRQAAASGRRDEKHNKSPKEKVYQDGPTSGMERVYQRDGAGLAELAELGLGPEIGEKR
jgi:hypothetical protein